MTDQDDVANCMVILDVISNEKKAKCFNRRYCILVYESDFAIFCM